MAHCLSHRERFGVFCFVGFIFVSSWHWVGGGGRDGEMSGIGVNDMKFTKNQLKFLNF